MGLNFCKVEGCHSWINDGYCYCYENAHDERTGEVGKNYDHPKPFPQAYIITKGEYSDYSVVCVCGNRETALAVLEKLYRIDKNDRDDYPRLETIPLLTDISQFEMQSMYYISVDMSGTEVTDSRYIRYNYCWNEYEEEWTFVTNSVQGYVNAASPRGFDVALKIARDKLTQILAEKKGIM